MKAAATLPFLLITLVATTLSAGEKPPKVPESELRELRIREMVEMIDLLGQGRVGHAVDKIEVLGARKFVPPAKNGLGGGERDRWVGLFGRFGTTKLLFESVELVAIQSISSRVKKVTLIAVGSRGPVLFHFRIFHYGGRYNLGNVGFDTHWERMEVHIAAVKNQVSNVFALSRPDVAKKTLNFVR